MTTQPGKPRLPVRAPADLLAVVPHLLGFTSEFSLVVIGMTLPSGRVQLAMRYDLPDPPDSDLAADIADHARRVLTRQYLTSLALVGYGPSPAVTPVADAVRAAAAQAGLAIREALRVEDGRYWSYLCTDPSCCSPDGEPFDVRSHPASQALADSGLAALPDREALAATVAPVTGPAASKMRTATRRAERAAVRLVTRDGPGALCQRGLKAVQDAISTYRAGDAIEPDNRHAWLALVVRQLPVRDDAWARMDPPTATRTAGCGPTWSAGRSPATSRPLRRCWPLPPGSAAREPWPTSRSSAPSPTIPANRWRTCSATRSTRACRRRWPPCR